MLLGVAFLLPKIPNLGLTNAGTAVVARWARGECHILLRQDDGKPRKIRVAAKDNRSACTRNEHFFLKTFESDNNATCPDLGGKIEVFTNESMLELETLGPRSMLNALNRISIVVI